MSRFYSLFSSSQGNAAFVGTPSGGILIDAGVSCRRLVQALSHHGIAMEAVQGIVITHTHTDHVKGLRVLLQKYAIPVYASESAAATLADHLPENAAFFSVVPGRTIHIGEMTVSAFATMHDAPGSCGYRICCADQRVCAVCTDLGCVTDEVLDGVTGADLVLLESNYDPEMLRRGPYPLPLQKRIQGQYGHLSNGESSELAVHLVEHGTTRLILGHLSPHNNTADLAQRTVLQQLAAHHYSCGREFLLEVALPEGLEKAVIF